MNENNINSEIPPITAEDGKHALEVALAAIESYKGGHIVRMG